MEKWLILGLGQEIYKMNLEHFVVPESKKVFKNKSRKHRSRIYTQGILSSGEDSKFSLLRDPVQSLVTGPKSHKPHVMAKTHTHTHTHTHNDGGISKGQI